MNLKEDCLNKKFIFVFLAVMIFINIFSIIVLATDAAKPASTTGNNPKETTATHWYDYLNPLMWLEKIIKWLSPETWEKSEQAAAKSAEELDTQGRRVHNLFWYWVITSITLGIGMMIIKSTKYFRGFTAKFLTWPYGGIIRASVFVGFFTLFLGAYMAMDYIAMSITSPLTTSTWGNLLGLGWIANFLFYILASVYTIVTLPLLSPLIIALGMIWFWPLYFFGENLIISILLTLAWLLGVPLLISFFTYNRKKMKRQQKAREIREAEQNLQAMGEELK